MQLAKIVSHACEASPPDLFPHPDDVIIDKATGEFTIDGPGTKEEAGELKTVREHATEIRAWYAEAKAAVEEEPNNPALRRELKQVQQYNDLLEQDARRTRRHEWIRRSRLALKAKPAEPNTAPPGLEHEDKEE